MKPKDADEKKASYFDMTFEVFGELDDTEDNEVEMIVVGRPRPRRWPRRLLSHDPFHEAVCAVRKGRTVFPNGAMHEA